MRVVQFLFVMDPPEGMLPDKDTSFAFMRAARARGHRVLHCLPRQMESRGAELWAESQPVEVCDQPPHVTTAAPEWVDVGECDAVFIRKDPPFDSEYLYLTQQLDRVKDRTLVVNDPTAVRSANEKLYALQFNEFMPPTLVSSNEARLLDFVEEVGGQAVIKPLDGAGGSGVAVLRRGDPNLKPLVGLLTAEGRRLAMVQEFQPAVLDGDKRVIVLDGKPLGTIRRVPQGGDIRANIHVGGRVEATKLTAVEHEMVTQIGRELSRVGLWFVGLDLIHERLIEVNVTSPTGIQELGRLTDTSPEMAVLEWVEEKAKGLRRA